MLAHLVLLSSKGEPNPAHDAIRDRQVVAIQQMNPGFESKVDSRLPLGFLRWFVNLHYVRRVRFSSFGRSFSHL